MRERLAEERESTSRTSNSSGMDFKGVFIRAAIHIHYGE